MIIRTATSSDCEGIAALYRQLNPDDPPIDKSRFVATLERISNDSGLELIVAEYSGSLVATCYLNIIPNLSRGGAPYAIIENVVTDQAHRRKGYGKAVVSFALERAWCGGCYKVVLTTSSHREATHAFYCSCGFSAGEKFAFVARSNVKADISHG